MLIRFLLRPKLPPKLNDSKAFKDKKIMIRKEKDAARIESKRAQEHLIEEKSRVGLRLLKASNRQLKYPRRVPR